MRIFSSDVRKNIIATGEKKRKTEWVYLFENACESVASPIVFTADDINLNSTLQCIAFVNKRVTSKFCVGIFD